MKYTRFALLFCITITSAQNTQRVVVTFNSTLQQGRFDGYPFEGNVTVVKAYGRRLVLHLQDEENPVNATWGLMGGIPDVVNVEQDSWVSILTAQPEVYAELGWGNQTEETYQWNLFGDYGINLENLTIRQGENGSIAILDSGLDERFQGWDFISDPDIANDGDGRDGNASDPGDSTEACPRGPSWHGLKVASIITGGIDLVGVAPLAKITSIRVLGACTTGYASDVADGIVWAAGGDINGMASNPDPSNILSLSLSGNGPCPSFLQSAITQANKLGSLVIVAAGNEAQSVQDVFPANCWGVLSVAASTVEGRLSSYSNLGADVAAPGGDWRNPVPVVDKDGGVSQAVGTSISVPHVSGIAAVIWRNNTLTKAILKNSTRPAVECLSQSCNIGILDCTRLKRSLQPEIPYTDNTIYEYNASNVTSNPVVRGKEFLNPISCDSMLWGESNGFVFSIAVFYDPGGDILNLCFTCRGRAGVVSFQECVGNNYHSSYTFNALSYDGINTMKALFGLTDIWHVVDLAVMGNWLTYSRPSVSILDALVYALTNNPGVVTEIFCPAGEFIYRLSIDSNYNDDAHVNNIAYWCRSPVCTPCTSGTYQVSGCTPLRNYICHECQTCTSAQYTASACTATEDTVCGSCGTLPSNAYWGSNCQWGCNAGYYTTGTSCIKCSTCDPHAQRIANCISNADGLCLCNAGYIGDGYTCSACLKGTFFDSSTTSCKTCIPGLYQSIIGQTACSTCQPGSYSGSGYTACTACTAGQYQTGYGVPTCTDGICSNEGSLAGCISCSVGYYQSMTSQSSCNACGTGKYQSSKGQTICSTCAPGTYLAGTGQMGALIGDYLDCTGGSCVVRALYGCTACTAGYYQTGGGMTSCTDTCNKYYYSLPGASSCTACPAGSYQPASAQSSCILCSPGYIQPYQYQSNCNYQCISGRYSSGSGLVSCTLCLPGYYQSSSGSTSCTNQCSAGKFSGEGQGICSDCWSGTAQPNTGQSTCISCNPGTYQNTYASTTCLPCAVGTYSYQSGVGLCTRCAVGMGRDQYQSATGQTKCNECQVGQYVDDYGMTACLLCPSGTYQTGTASYTCNLCNVGTFQTGTGSSSCSACGSGGYQTGTGATSCIPCGLGTYKAGTELSCTPCGAGTYQTGTGFIGSYQCSVCGAGSYQSGLGSAGCTLCEPGSYQTGLGYVYCDWCLKGVYQSGIGSTSCTYCESGTFQSGWNKMSISDCIQCAAGKYQTGSGMTASSDCTACGVGKYQSGTGMSTCTACGAGTEQAGTGASTCTACSKGMYKVGTAMWCYVCPEGTYQTGTGMISPIACLPCGIGRYSPYQGLTSPSECPTCDAGKYQTGTGFTSSASCVSCGQGVYQTGVGMSACTQCGAGTYQTGTGMTLSSNCLSCSSGSYQTVTGQSICLYCVAGSFAAFGQTSCTLCSPGYSQPSPGMSTCTTQCSTGSYASGSGQSACTLCSAGFYQSIIGRTSCPNGCSVGSYSNVGQSVCTTCGAGAYMTDTTCNYCVAGTYSSRAGMYSVSACVSCPLLSYNINSGSTSCTSCPGGTYQYATGMTACNICSPGTYMTSTSVSTNRLDLTNVIVSWPLGDPYYNANAINVINTNTPDYNQGFPYFSLSVCSLTILQIQLLRVVAISNIFIQGEYNYYYYHTYCMIKLELSTTCAFNGEQYTAYSCESNCPTTGRLGFDIPVPYVNALCVRWTNGPDANGIIQFIKLILLGSFTPCTSCIAGTYSTGSGMTTTATCSTCAAGRYNTAVGSSSCFSCGVGTYLTGTGMTTTCSSCSSGKYQTGTGMSTCVMCNAGSYQTGTGITTSCPLCITGSYQTGTGITTSCPLCSTGSYQTGTGVATSCPLCSAGTYQSGTGMDTSCSLCSTGTYQTGTGMSTCQVCIAGLYQTGTGMTAVCLSCNVGSYQTGTGMSTCLICSTGSYQSGVATTSCQACNIGTYQSATGATVACTSCPTGTYNIGTSSSGCTTCSPGTYMTAPAGSGSTLVLTTDMVTWPIAYPHWNADPTNVISSDAYNSNLPYPSFNYGWDAVGIFVALQVQLNTITTMFQIYICSVGFYNMVEISTTCGFSGEQQMVYTSINVNSNSDKCGTISIPGLNVLCIRWTMAPALMATIVFRKISLNGAVFCQTCAKGTYNTGTGMTSVCSNCPIGKYNPIVNGTTCFNCNPGSYSSGLGASVCSSCNVGTYQTGSGMSACVPCGAGTYMTGSGAITCLPCSTGTYQTGSGMNTCPLCNAGTYTTGSGAVTCPACSAGTYQTGSGMNTCPPCNAGTYTTGSGADTCPACSAGTYQTGSGLNICPSCSAGTYQTGTGMTSISNCISCNTGTYQTGTGIASTSGCLLCAAGTYQTGTGINYVNLCSYCTSGTYSTGSGMTTSDTCLGCNYGTYYTGSGLTSVSGCSNCLPGTYGTATACTGTSSCLNCMSGTYNSLNGATNCLSCESGAYQTGSGAASCLKCLAGKYNTGTGMSTSGACSLCITGTYNTGTGLTAPSDCNTCNTGQYSTGTGMTAPSTCTVCATGAYQTGTGTSSCLFCSSGTYVSVTGTTSCLSCLSGMYSSGTGMKTSQTCTQCNVGTYSTGTGMVETGACLVCPANMYASSTGVSACLACNPGTFNLFVGYSACLLCPAGTYKTLSSTADLCLLCNPGTYSTSLGAATVSCSNCVAGKYSTGSGVTTCTSCVAGSYSTGTGYPYMPCTPCSEGTYSSGTGMTTASICSSCSAGTYNTGVGSSQTNDCYQCFTGSYSSGTGMTTQSVCTQCSAGTYNSMQGGTSLSRCVQCNAGTYSSGMGVADPSKCLLCSAGTYNSGTGMTAISDCMICSAGTYSSGVGMNRSSVCTICSAGTYSSGTGMTSSSNCYACSAGAYQTGTGMTDVSTCTACDAGMYQTGTGMTLSSACAACSAGKYSSGTGMALSSACLTCDAGMYQTGTGMTTSSMCAACSAGKYSSGTGMALSSTCLTCAAGNYQTGTGMTGVSMCLTCSAGMYQTGTAMTTNSDCTACSAGKYSSGTGMTISTVCLSCAAGTYQTGTGLTANSDCSICSAGKYSSGVGMPVSSTCLSCSAGLYSTGTGMTLANVCLSCAAGMYQTGTGLTSSAGCSICSAGKYSSGVGMTVSSTCLSCSAGLYSTGTGMTQANVCLSCAAGTYQTGTGLTANSDCSVCSAGKYSSGVGMTVSSTCLSCSAGLYSTGTGMTQANVCLSCVAGTYQTGTGLTSSAGCSICSAGKYSSGVGMTVSSTCLSCSAGKYSSGVGMTVASVCSNCPAGMYASGTGVTQCMSCTTGTYQTGTGMDSQSSCLSCLKGAYQSGLSATVCTQCKNGTYQNTTGASFCSTCDAGSYLTGTGCTSIANCTLCIVGTYQSSAGMAGCTTCQNTAYQTVVGATVCSTCGIGTYQNSSGLCTGCPSGTFQSGYGMMSLANCSLCGAGTYQTGTGMPSLANCSLCGAGTYQTGTGMPSLTSCSLCGTGTYQTGTGMPSLASCSLCGAGTYQTGTGMPSLASCSLCGAGTYQTGTGMPSLANCSLCGTGTYQTGTGMPSLAKCSLCGAGMYQTGTGIPSQASCVLCWTGTYQTGTGMPSPASCNPCGTGTYQTGTGMPSLASCSLCGTGTYQTGTGMPSLANCSLCGTGLYQTGLGMPSPANCSLCGPGLYQTGLGMPIQASCSLCGPGLYQTGLGMPSPDNCNTCGAGMYQTGSGMPSPANCYMCGTGRYQTGSGMPSPGNCSLCGAGTYQTGTGMPSLTSCSLCGTGKYQTGSGMPSPANCYLCGVGMYQTGTGMPSPASCNTCGAGMYQTGSGMPSPSNCSLCEAGKYQTGSGMPSPANCYLCGVGMYQTGTGMPSPANCNTCGAGMYQTGTGMPSSGNCNLCGAGMYQTGTGMPSPANCSLCGTGMYQTGSGMPSSGNCNLCGAGMYQTGSGMPSQGNCNLCGTGMYQTGTGMPSPANCSLCGTGMYQTGSGMPSPANCSLCFTGTYQTGSSMPSPANCNPCGTGMYQTGSGMQSPANCNTCDAGTYQTGTGMPSPANCSLCSTGTYQTGTGMSSPANCNPCGTGTYQTGTGMPSPANCNTCVTGTYQTGTGMPSPVDCSLCGTGRYQTGTGMPSPANCNTCEAGMYQTGTGATLASACTACGAGYYSTEPGASNEGVCTPCGTGAYQPLAVAGNASLCLACIAGTYQPMLVVGYESMCTPCPLGEFSPSASASICQICPKGSFSNATGSTACLLCQAGKYSQVLGSNSSQTCLACSPGYYSSSDGASTCVICMSGQYSTVSGSTGCDQCSTGRYSTQLGLSRLNGLGEGSLIQSGTVYSSQLDAVDSTFTISAGSMSSLQAWLGDAINLTFSDLTLIGSGKFTIAVCSTPACVPAESTTVLTSGKSQRTFLVPTGYMKGTFKNDIFTGCTLSSCHFVMNYKVYQSMPCLSCTTGYYQNHTGSSTCDPCSPGTFQNQTASSSCYACPIGMIAASPGSTACTACGPGRYQNNTGQSDCMTCLAGAFQSAYGSTACDECAPGSYQDASSQSGCIQCDPGRFSPNASSTACSSCPHGAYQNATGSTACVACPPGSYQNVSSQSACVLCALGSYMYTAGSTRCTTCPNGTYADQEGKTMCTACARTVNNIDVLGSTGESINCGGCLIGTYWNGSSCLDCLAGTYTEALDMDHCHLCETGMYQPEATSTACLECPPGSFSSLQGQTGCERCSPGSYTSNYGNPTCQYCWPGTYADQEGYSWCLSCLPGSYSDQEGVTSANCTQCPPGTFQDAYGSTTCHACDTGYFQDSTQQTACKICPSGYISPDLGGTYCKACDPGYYQPALGARQCLGCLPGTTNPSSGQSACAPCTPGTYQAYHASPDPVCTLCPAGTFSNATGLSNILGCALCPWGYVSASPGRTDNSTCEACAQGTAGNSLRTACTACTTGTVCPAAYGSPIVCPSTVLCDGVRATSTAGYVAIVRDRGVTYVEGTATTGAQWMSSTTVSLVRCPKGSLCSKGGEDKALVFAPGNKTMMILLGNGTVLRVDTLEASLLYSFVVGFGVHDCEPGWTLIGDTCAGCSPGTYWLNSFDNCLPCQRGTFSTMVASSACTKCQEGTAQNKTGQTGCTACSANQYSSQGDSECSTCGSSLSPEQYSSCNTPNWTNQSELVWLTTTGSSSSYDSCMGIGLSSIRDNVVSQGMFSFLPVTTCVNTLRILGQTSLYQTWSNPLVSRNRPSVLSVYRFNDTIYHNLCHSQGLGVVYTMTDSQGDFNVDLQEVQVSMSILDFASEILLYVMVCNSAPSVETGVFYGQCITSFCPSSQFIVRVQGVWDTGSVQGSTDLRVAPDVSWLAPSSWVMDFELVGAGDVKVEGDLVYVPVTSYATPGTIQYFAFALTLSSRVTFLSFSSPYTARASVQSGVLSCQGTSQSATSAGVSSNVLLGTLAFRVLAGRGVYDLFCVTPDSTDVTLASAMRILGTYSARGYTKEDSGCVTAMLDTRRVTSLWARASKLNLVYWSAQVSYPAQIFAYAVYNVMGDMAKASPSCYSSSVSVSSDCSVVNPVNTASDAAGVSISYAGASTMLYLKVYTVQVVSTLTLAGRRSKVIVNLVRPSSTVQNVDATPFLRLPEECSACAPQGARTYTGVLVFQGGSTGPGTYTLSTPVLSPDKPLAWSMAVVTDESMTAWLTSEVLSGDTSRLKVEGTQVSLLRLGQSSKCVSLGVYNATLAWILVLQPSPQRLDIRVQTDHLVVGSDISGSFQSSTQIIAASMVMSDGTTVDVLQWPDLRIYSNQLTVSGLTVSAILPRLSVFSASLYCLSTNTLIYVSASGVVSKSLKCDNCQELTMPDDPLSILYPDLYPSSLHLAEFSLEMLLFDGTYKQVPAALSSLVVTGGVSLAGPSVQAASPGLFSVSYVDSSPYRSRVNSRWAKQASLLCSGSSCAGFSVTYTGDGASKAPFLLPTTIQLYTLLVLQDGAQRAMGANSMVTYYAQGNPLPDGLVTVDSSLSLSLNATLDPSWLIPSPSTTLGVVSLSSLQVDGTPSLSRLHCTNNWGMGSIVVTATLSNGRSATVTNEVDSTTAYSSPLVRDSEGVFSAQATGTGTITVTMGRAVAAHVTIVSNSSRLLTWVALNGIPSQWTGKPGDVKSMNPSVTGWQSSIVKQIIQVTSVAPSYLGVLSGFRATLLENYHQIVQLMITIPACDQQDQLVMYQPVACHVRKTTNGELDVGPELGLPIAPAAVGASVSIPIYVYSTAPLQSYTVEVRYPNGVLDWERADTGSMKDSLCVVLKDATGFYFRAVGSDLGSSLQGRTLACTIALIPVSDALATLQVSLLDCRIANTVVAGHSTTYNVKLGTGTPPVSFLPPPVPSRRRRLLQASVWGDTEGTGSFSSLSVQFLEEYLYRVVFPGDQQICVSKCQWISQITPWQYRMLNPVSDPYQPPGRPSGLSRLFLLGVLVENYHFLSGWSIQSTLLSFNMSVQLTNRRGEVNPADAMVYLTLYTKLNTGLLLDSKTTQTNESIEVELLQDRQFSAAVISGCMVYKEVQVPVTILQQTVDATGQTSAKRMFRFYPEVPFTFVSIMGINWTAPVLPSLPIVNCTVLCQDSGFNPGVDLPAGNTSTAAENKSVVSVVNQPPVSDSPMANSTSRGVSLCIVQTQQVDSYTCLLSAVYFPVELETNWTIELDNQSSVSIPCSNGICASDACPIAGWFGNYTQRASGHIMGCKTEDIQLMPVHSQADIVAPTIPVLEGQQFNIEINTPGPSVCSVMGRTVFSPGNVPVKLSITIPYAGTYQLNVTCVSGVEESNSSTTQVTVNVTSVTNVGLWSVNTCEYLVQWSKIGGVDDSCPIVNYAVPPVGPAYLIDGTTATIDSPNGLRVWTPFGIQLAVANTIVAPKTPWIATCSLISGTQVIHEVVFNKQVFAQGLLYIYPAGVVTYDERYIVAQNPGMAGLYLGNQVVTVSVPAALSQPVSLSYLLYSGVSSTLQGNRMVTTYSAYRMASNTTGWLLLYAHYEGGYTIQLMPTDQMQISSVNDYVYTRGIDQAWAVSVTSNCTSSTGPLLFVEYSGVRLIISGTLHARVPVLLTVCCDAILAHSESPASQFYGSWVTLQHARVVYDDGYAFDIELPDVTQESDTRYLTFNSQSGWYVIRFVYTNPVTTLIHVSFTDPYATTVITASMSILIVDLKSFSVQTFFPQGLGPAEKTLYNLQCSSTYQSLSVTGIATVDSIGSYAIPDRLIVLRPTKAGILMINGTVAQGISPGTTDLLVMWRGYSVTIRSIRVVKQGLSVTYAHSPDYFVDAPVRLSLSVTITGADQVSQIQLDNILDVHPDWVEISLPPSVSITGNFTLLPVSNSQEVEQVTFSFKMCPIQYQVVASLVVNLVPQAGDLDIGEEAGLAIPPDALSLPLRLHMQNTEVFLVELETDWNITSCGKGGQWTGLFSCSILDTNRVVRIAGAGQSQSGVVEIAVLSVTDTWGETRGTVDTYLSDTRSSQAVIAGSFATVSNQSYTTSLAIVDITTLYRQFRCMATTGECPMSSVWNYILVLVHKRRVVQQTSLYSSSLELSVMVQLVDRFAVPDLTQSRVWILFHTLELPAQLPNAELTPYGLWVTCAHIQDGWYGISWKDVIPETNMSLSFALQTTEDTGQYDPDRIMVLGQVPIAPFASASQLRRRTGESTYASMVTGVPQPQCPRMAYNTGVIKATYAVSCQTSLESQEVAQCLSSIIGCKTGVAARRVAFSRMGANTVMSVVFESFPKMFEANILLLDPVWLSDQFAACSNASVLAVQRGRRYYITDNPDVLQTCPPQQYFEEGAYHVLPMHAFTSRECYGFSCYAGFVLYQGACIAENVSDGMYWNVLALVVLLLVALSLVGCLVIGCRKARAKRLPTVIEEEEEDPDEYMLPVDVDKDGNLVFEAMTEDDPATEDEKTNE